MVRFSKKTGILVIVLSLFALIVALSVTYLIYPKFFLYYFASEGSRADIKEMKRLFKSGEYITNESHLFVRYDDNSWAYLIATNSHAPEYGGTVGVLESTGKTHFWFTHVCGYGLGIPINIAGNNFSANQLTEDKVKIDYIQIPEKITVIQKE